MSKWVPREEHAKNLTQDQLIDFYIKADPRKKKPVSRSRAGTKTYPSSVKGRGSYNTNTGKQKKGYVPNAPADASFSPNYGARLGSVIGEGLQSFANAIGFGEYNIQQNSCLKMIDMGTSPPRVRNTNRGEATIVNHREYLGDLLTGTGTPTVFDLQTYAINPGNPSLFPFCADISKNFQEWEIRGMLVELKSLASNTATSLSLGSMFAAVDYNSLDAAPANKIQLENMEYACSNKPTDSILMPIECARKNDVMTHLYIAEDSDYQGGDRRLYDLGKLYVGSYGCPVASAPIAEIWITYEIALYKPHLHIPDPFPSDSLRPARFYGHTTTNSEPLGNPVPFTANPFFYALAGNDLTIINNVTHPVTKYYNITLWWRTQATISGPKPPGVSVSGDGAIVVNQFAGIAGPFAQTYAFTPTSTLINTDSVSFSFIVSVTGNSSQAALVSFDTTGVLVGGSQTTRWDMFISETYVN